MKRRKFFKTFLAASVAIGTGQAFRAQRTFRFRFQSVVSGQWRAVNAELLDKIHRAAEAEVAMRQSWLISRFDPRL